jgi:hypothetical protein
MSFWASTAAKITTANVSIRCDQVSPRCGLAQIEPVVVVAWTQRTGPARSPTLQAALAQLRPTHVFLCTWKLEETEAENIRVNGAMILNVLDAVRPGGAVEHVALVTGLKHYLGPSEWFAKGFMVTSFRETQPRLEYENFYYEQEDRVYDAAARDGFSWSVHRPHTMIGYAINNAMNFATTLAVYA